MKIRYDIINAPICNKCYKIISEFALENISRDIQK